MKWRLSVTESERRGVHAFLIFQLFSLLSVNGDSGADKSAY